VFRIPILLVVTLRGDPQLNDEPQHELMGRVTTDILDTLQIPWRWFPDSADAVTEVLDAALAHMDSSGRPFALVMRKGQVAAHALNSPAPQLVEQFPPPGREAFGADPPSRREVLAALQEASPEQGSVLIATTGYTGRELYALADRPNQLYMVGSMGCASSLGLGLAMVRPELTVVVADGDGAALMRMGNLASIGAYAGNNFAHVLLDNGQHESTGGQATVSHAVDFAAVAASCGYARARQCSTSAAVRALVQEAVGPRFAHIRTRPGVPAGLPRPSITPSQVRSRLLRQLGVQVPWGDTG
jgi:phosphonopyruvate decarboxylase